MNRPFSSFSVVVKKAVARLLTGNDTVTSAITVEVVDGSFPAENPACLVGRERQWSFDTMSTNMVFEVDDTVELSVLNTTNLTLNTVALRANDTNGDHVMLARL